MLLRLTSGILQLTGSRETVAMIYLGHCVIWLWDQCNLCIIMTEGLCYYWQTWGLVQNYCILITGYTRDMHETLAWKINGRVHPNYIYGVFFSVGHLWNCLYFNSTCTWLSARLQLLLGWGLLKICLLIYIQKKSILKKYLFDSEFESHLYLTGVAWEI